MTVTSHADMPLSGKAHPVSGDAMPPGRYERMLLAAEPLREELRGKRTATLSRLFEFLFARTFEGRPPSELEIANEVFSDGRVIDSTQDSTVRVYVHRLRKLTESLYSDCAGPALEIPKGEYCVRLIEPARIEEQGLVSKDRPNAEPADVPMKPAWPLVAVGALLVLVLSVFFFRWPAADSLSATAFWRPLAANSRPVTIVLGDKYLFAQADPRGTNAAGPPRLVWDRSIAAREDFFIYQMRNPQEAENITDLNQHYVSSSSVIALRDIRAALASVKGKRHNRVRVISSSQLTPDILKSSDIVYVGLLSGLNPLLRDPLFEASGLKPGPTSNEMIDRPSGKIFQSDGVVLTEERIPRRDYGYMARMPGPSGNTIVIITGTRDAGLLEMAELARSSDRLDAARLPAAATLHGMEALYRVRTMGSLNLGSTLVLKRKLQSQGVWDTSQTSAARP